MVSFSLFLRSPVLPSELVGAKFGGWMVVPSPQHDPGNMVEGWVAQFWYLNGVRMAAILGCVFMGLAVETWFPDSSDEKEGLLAVPDVKPPASQMVLVSLSVAGLVTSFNVSMGLDELCLHVRFGRCRVLLRRDMVLDCPRALSLEFRHLVVFPWLSVSDSVLVCDAGCCSCCMFSSRPPSLAKGKVSAKVWKD